MRLLVLDPATDPESVLRASFRTVCLDNVPPYEAISYTWGAPEFPERIEVDNRLFPITTNLACALKSFRQPDTERILWADAICINQKDVQEKSQQVAMMARIYQKARRVLIWLGESCEKSQRAMEGYRFIAGMMGFGAGMTGISVDTLLPPLVEKYLFS